MNGTNQILVHTKIFNILGENFNATHKSTEVLLNANKSSA